MSSAVTEALDLFVEGFDKTIEAVTGVFKKEGEPSTQSAGGASSTSNERVFQQDEEKL
jgi:hypothetical protein